MSTATKQAMDDAIAAHLADEAAGAMVTGYILKLEGRNIANITEGESTTRWEIAENQSVITTVGLSTALYRDVLDWYRVNTVEEDDS